MSLGVALALVAGSVVAGGAVTVAQSPAADRLQPHL